jgi:hypothetical protein
VTLKNKKHKEHENEQPFKPKRLPEKHFTVIKRKKFPIEKQEAGNSKKAGM